MTAKDIFIGEYANYILNNQGEVYTHVNGNLKKFPIQEKIITGSAGHPYGTFIGESGQVYLVRSGDQSIKIINIKNGIKSTSWYNRHVVLCKDGSVKVFDEAANIIDLKIPGIIKDVSASGYLLILDENGSVWQYNWLVASKTIMSFDKLKTLSPIKINLPGPATHIATGVIQSAVVNGDPWIWTDAYGARFVKNTPGSLPATNFRSRMFNNEKVVSIAVSDNVLHIVTDAGRLMGLGNTWIGEIGNGSQAPKITETNVADFAYTQYFYNFVDVSQNRKYLVVRSGSYYGFRHFALEIKPETNETLWSSWGYSKFGLLMNGITPVDDTANVAKGSIKTPRRIQIPESTKIVTTGELNMMIAAGTYPPEEAKFPEPIIFYNKEVSKTFNKSGCKPGWEGSSVTYTVLAKKYSGITQVIADAEAQKDIDENGQKFADETGICIDRRKLIASIKVYDNGDVEKQEII